MRLHHLTLFLILHICNASANKQQSVPGIVKANLEYVQTPLDAQNSHIRKRQVPDGGMFEEPMFNFLTFYTMNVTIGTPEQNLSVLLDTGSSDLWIPGDGFENGFLTDQSSTWKLLSKDFAIKYVKGFAKGLWGTDKIQFKSSGAVLENQRFAVATDSSEADMGVFGIGSVNSEVSKPLYDNIPVSMVKQGLIHKNAYSIYLEDQDAKTGCILFGGIDTAKFVPPLTTMSFTSTSALEVTLNEITIGESTYHSDTPIVLDTGTSLMYLPQRYVDAIAAYFGAKYDHGSSLYRIPKDKLEDDTTISNVTFNIMGAKIEVPPKELFWPVQWFTGDDDESDDYVLTIMSNTEALGFNILGDTFLRSAYTVVDLEYRQVSLAQVNFSNDSNLVPIVSSVPTSPPKEFKDPKGPKSPKGTTKGESKDETPKKEKDTKNRNDNDFLAKE